MNYIHQFKAEILASTLRKEAPLASAWLSQETFSFLRKLVLPLDNQTASKILCSVNIQFLKNLPWSLCQYFSDAPFITYAPSLELLLLLGQLISFKSILLMVQIQLFPAVPITDLMISLVPWLPQACCLAVSPVHSKRCASTAYTACRTLDSFLSFISD